VRILIIQYIRRYLWERGVVSLLHILELSVALLFNSVCTGDAQTDEEPKDKREAKVMHLLRKVWVLDKFHRGMGMAAVGRHYCLTEWKIYCLNHRNSVVKMMEMVLCVWLEDTEQKKLSVSGAVVRENVMQLYKYYAESGSEEKFTSMQLNDGVKNLRSGQEL
jgi:hypothetical protein